MDQVNVNATFQEDDIFKRKQYARIGMKLIEAHPANRGACSIAIDASWGVGKSTFLHMWINELDLGNTLLYPSSTYASEFRGKNVLPIYYNAWEHDFSESALVPLLYTICAQLDKKHTEGWLLPDDENAIIEFVSTCSGLLLMLLTFMYSKDEVTSQAVGTAGGMTIKGLLHLFSRYLSRDCKEPEPDSLGAIYDKQLKAREEFREALTSLSAKCGGLYIFIDELDRCKPSFAIETLETIKHYFDIPGLVFVFGIDMTQLSYAISRRYGEHYDSGGYLSKFFDHHIILPTPSTEQMLLYGGLNLWFDSDNYRHLDEIFHACKVSPREIPRVLKASETLLTLLFSSIAGFSKASARELVFLLVSMRYRLPDVYNRYVSGDPEWNKYSWNEDQLFFSMLAFFDHSMNKSVSECNKSWIANIPFKGGLGSEETFRAEMSSIGCGIIDCTHPGESISFGKCMSLFMEKVYI